MPALQGVHQHRCRLQVDQAAKLSPQEQCETAFGFVTLKPPFCRSSLKSRTDTLTKSALLGSTTIRTLDDRTRVSRGAGPSTRSILYCRPEQPPPITARRKAPCGRPCFSSSELRRRAAFSVTLISFSLPILIPFAGWLSFTDYAVAGANACPTKSLIVAAVAKCSSAIRSTSARVATCWNFLRSAFASGKFFEYAISRAR